MAYAQYTQCYNHTPGDKPFNRDDLLAFVAGASAPGLIGAIALFLNGNFATGLVVIAIQYAATIIAVANEWLYHRLVCVSGDQCAVGSIETLPEVGSFGEFDNDQYFDMRLMPHRHEDEYRAPNTNFFKPTSNPAGTIPWQRGPSDPLPAAGPSLDGKTGAHPENDIFLDNFQGSLLLRPLITDLPYTPVDVNDTPLKPDLPAGTQVTRSTLHCEAEGNFWDAMKATAALQGAATAAGAAGGAALGCAIGGIFGPIGCLIGALLGGLAGAAAGAFAGASAAFNSDPGDVNDANVGDRPLGQLAANDRVVVYGTHVYDGFHTGWHEFHPLKAIMKYSADDPLFQNVSPYLEWDPNASTDLGALSASDIKQGLASPAFNKAAHTVKDQWCRLLSERFDPATIGAQNNPNNRSAIHPAVDGCQPSGTGGPPPPR